MSRTLKIIFMPWVLLPPEARDFLARRGEETLGLGLIAAAGFSAVALASWHAADPSFNNATAAPPANLAGLAGAHIADLFYQSVGLAALALIVPPALWGWRLLAHAAQRRLAWRLIAWTALAGFGVTFLAGLPAPAIWPLPVGLGGVAGDGLNRLAAGALASVLGAAPAQFSVTLLSGIFAGAAFLAAGTLSLAAAGALADRIALWREERAEARAWRRRDVEPGKLRIAAYWLGDRLTGMADFLLRRKDDDIVSAPPRRARRPVPPPGRAPESAPAPGAAGRISRTTKRPRQGKRAAREAQPTLSFLAGDDYELPPLNLLREAKRVAAADLTLSDEALEQNARLLESVLDDFGIRGQIINVRPGPVVTLYELEPAAGIKSSRVIALADDIARSMSAVSARVAVVPGRNAIGIELPNSRREMVYLRELLSSADYESTTSKLALALGKNIGGEPVIGDLERMPHLLIAGTTGSGKSVGINTMILSLVYRLSPDQCKLIMIDPKMLELSVYDGIPHLLAPVVTEPKKAVVALKWVVKEMEERYRNMSKVGVRNIDNYNVRVIEADEKGEVLVRTVQTGFDKETGEAIYEEEEMELEPMPYIVVIVDEMADLMMVAGKDIEAAVQRLAQMARAAGIHLITATQRPSVDVITGTIKANFPTRISFQVTSKIDSRTILGEQGAEQLLGQGDMLFMAGGGRIRRVHGPFVSDEEVEKVVRYLKKQGTPEYLEAVTEAADDDTDPFGFGNGGSSGDDLYDQAVAIVGRDKRASTSYIQRKLQIGYNRAARIIEQMEEEGVVSPPNHAGKREVLIGEPGDGVRY